MHSLLLINWYWFDINNSGLVFNLFLTSDLDYFCNVYLVSTNDIHRIIPRRRIPVMFVTNLYRNSF